MSTPEKITPAYVTEAQVAFIRELALQGQYLNRSIQHYAQKLADREAAAVDQLRAEVELGEELQAATEQSLKLVTAERDELRARAEETTK